MGLRMNKPTAVQATHNYEIMAQAHTAVDPEIMYSLLLCVPTEQRCRFLGGCGARPKAHIWAFLAAVLQGITIAGIIGNGSTSRRDVMESCNGNYFRSQKGEMFNGTPIWIHTTGRRFLYRTTAGTWAAIHNRIHFSNNKGFAISSSTTALSPADVATWNIDGSPELVAAVVPMTNAAVNLALRKIHARANHAAAIQGVVLSGIVGVGSKKIFQESCNGSYLRSPCEELNGASVWVHTNGSRFLYRNRHGFWVATGDRSHFLKNIGYIASSSAADLTPANVLGWTCTDGREWVDIKAVAASMTAAAVAAITQSRSP